MKVPSKYKSKKARHIVTLTLAVFSSLILLTFSFLFYVDGFSKYVGTNGQWMFPFFTLFCAFNWVIFWFVGRLRTPQGAKKYINGCNDDETLMSQDTEKIKELIDLGNENALNYNWEQEKNGAKKANEVLKEQNKKTIDLFNEIKGDKN